MKHGACATVADARPEDIDALEALEEIFPEADRISRRSWQRFLRKGAAVLVIRSTNGIAASAVLLFRENSATARLYSLAVTPEARGRGYARALLAAFEERAKTRGCRLLNLEARASNETAIELYRSAGFETAGNLPGYYDDGEDGLKMRKVLRASET